jgi:hypothetical protein
MRLEVQPGYNVDTKLRKTPFFPGEQFDLEDEKEARRLIDLGVVKETTGEEGAAPGPQTPLNVTETGKLIAVAIFADLAKFRGDERQGVINAIAKREKELEVIDLGVVANTHNPADLDTLAEGETRTAILEAIEKRRTELTESAE